MPDAIVPSTEENKAPSPEELAAHITTIGNEMWDNETLSRHAQKPKAQTIDDFPEEEKKPDPEKKPDEEKKEPEKKDEPKPEPEKKPEPEVKKEEERKLTGLTGEQPEVEAEPQTPPVAPKQPIDALDADEIAERAAEKALEKLQPKDKSAEDPYAGLSANERRQLEVIEFLNKNEKYKGRNLVKEVRTFWEKEAEFVAKWQKEHPEEKFDESLPEVASWYQKNEASIPDADEIDDAKVEMRVDKVRQELLQKQEEAEALRRMEQDRETRVAKVKPISEQKAVESVVELISQVPEFKELVKDGKLTKEAVAKMQEMDPETTDLLDREAVNLKVRVKEFNDLTMLGEYVQLDPTKRVKTDYGDTIMPHNDIIEAHMELEQRIFSQPVEKQIHNGKRFVTRQEYVTRRNAILQGQGSDDQKKARVSELDDRVWTVSNSDIRDMLVAQSAKKVIQTRELIQRRVSRLTPKQEEKKPDEKQAEQSKKTTQKPPPSIAAESDLVDSGKITPAGTKSHAEIVNESMWR